MCLLLIAVQHVPASPLLLLGNRDEFRGRPSLPAAPWTDAPAVVGGRDLVAGGSWLAIEGGGRYAAVTNLRNGLPATAPRSRGLLVGDYVRGSVSPDAFLAQVRAQIETYGPFNLIVGDAEGAWLLAGGSAAIHRLEPGVHVVSNGRFGTQWPKTERLRRRFAEAVARADRSDDTLLALLSDTWQPPDEQLPDTGVGLAMERRLAPVFVQGEHYGTRASTLAAVDAAGIPRLAEVLWPGTGEPSPATRWRYEGTWVRDLPR